MDLFSLLVARKLSGGGGGKYQSKTATPTTSQQIIEPSEGFDALSSVTIEPTPLESKSVVPGLQGTLVTPTSPNIGLSEVTVQGLNAYLSNAYVTPTTSQQIIDPVSPNMAFRSVTVEGVTSAIDSNIQADNIKQGVNILGVTGTVVPYIPPLEEKDVNFYDYDGALLYAYTAQDFLALTEMPELPTHEEVTANQWNWSLENMKAYVTDYGKCITGVSYIAPVTKFYHHITDSSQLNLVLYCKLKNGTLTIKLGDTVLATETESSNTDTDHDIAFTMPTPQSYPFDAVLTLEFSGSGNLSLGRSDKHIYDKAYLGTFVKAIIGQNTIIGDDAFGRCYALEKIIISEGITVLGSSAFNHCISLKSITLPKGLLTFGYSSVFSECVNLETVLLSDTMTQLSNDYSGSTFNNCASLRKICIPPLVARLGSNLFYYCTSLEEIIIPKNVLGVLSRVFAYCCKLKDIKVYRNISIGMFSYCVSITAIKLENSTAEIQQEAFRASDNLMVFDLTAYTDPQNLPTLGTLVFYTGNSEMVILVANQEMLDAFSSATNWSAYASQMQIQS